MEGSEVIVMGSITVGRSPQWFQGTIRDTFKLNKETEEDVNETLGITIKHTLMVNNWGERCSIKVPKTVTIVVDKVLTSVLASIAINEDTEISEKPSVYEDYGKTEDSKTNEDSTIEGLEICFSSIDFRPEFDAAEEMLIDNDMQIELVLEIEAFPQGKGFRTLNDSWEDKKEILGKNIKAEITLIIGKKNEGKTDVLRSLLNGVER